MLKLYLIRYPDPPMKIAEKNKTTIGRSEGNTIVLPERRASRIHAQIEWSEQSKKFLLSDLNSSNGTYLNGKKIMPTETLALQDWDKIRIASAVFTARFVSDPGVLKYEFKELRQRVHTEATEIINVSELEKMINSEPVLSGSLEHLCAIELFQMLENGRKTGVLTIKTDDCLGTFGIQEGNIITAQVGDLIGETAVFNILNCNKGQFAFLAQPSINETAQISIPTTMLLMEGCRLLDEANAAAQAPES
jgi:hypothetical protein